MIDKQIRSRYFVHSFLHKFTEELFFAFGALLIFAKTGSVVGTLGFAIVGSATSLLMKSLGFSLIERLLRAGGLMPSMTLGLILKVIALCGIFYIGAEMENFYQILFSLHVLENIGNTMYVIGANAIMFGVIGRSRTPGHSSAQITVLHTLAGLLAAGTGILLSGNGNFLYGFLIGGFVLLGSTIPLAGLPTPRIPSLSFVRNLRRISLPMFLANINPNHQIKTTGLPLVILAVSASLQFSIWVNAAIAVLTIFAAYAAGWVRDHHGAWLTWTALAVGIVAWGFYGFASTAMGFLLPSIFIGLSTQILSIGREARMSKDLQSADNILGGTMAIEFARSIGGFVGSAILLIGYVSVGYLPQMILALGGLFLIPKAIYAARGRKL